MKRWNRQIIIFADGRFFEIIDRIPAYSNSGLRRLNCPSTESEEEQRRAVIDFLNHYEIVSIGIRHDILDEQIYKDWMKHSFVRDWTEAKDFIQHERWKKDANNSWRYNTQVYENFETIACRWAQDGSALKLTAQTSGPPSKAEGPGDEPLPEVHSG